MGGFSIGPLLYRETLVFRDNQCMFFFSVWVFPGNVGPNLKFPLHDSVTLHNSVVEHWRQGAGLVARGLERQLYLPTTGRGVSTIRGEGCLTTSTDLSFLDLALNFFVLKKMDNFG